MTMLTQCLLTIVLLFYVFTNKYRMFYILRNTELSETTERVKIIFRGKCNVNELLKMKFKQ